LLEDIYHKFYNEVSIDKDDAYRLAAIAETLIEDERERMADGVRKWLVSNISDYELCLILGISKYDWNILIQEKESTFNSYCASLVDECDNPNCKIKRILNNV
jgi:hypothetical protein